MSPDMMFTLGIFLSWIMCGVLSCLFIFLILVYNKEAEESRLTESDFWICLLLGTFAGPFAFPVIVSFFVIMLGLFWFFVIVEELMRKVDLPIFPAIFKKINPFPIVVPLKKDQSK